jgi:hypothetical protein
MPTLRVPFNNTIIRAGNEAVQKGNVVTVNNDAVRGNTTNNSSYTSGNPLANTGVTSVTDSSYSSVDEYIANVQDFARAYLFRVFLMFPTGFTYDTSVISCFAKSTNLPDTAMEEVSSYYMGQQYKQASVRRFTDWQMTMYIDKKTDLLLSFYKWNRMCQSKDNTYGEPDDYALHKTGQQTIWLLDSSNLKNPVMVFKLHGAWPKAITNVALDYNTNDFLTMDLNWSYQYHDITKSSTYVDSGGDSEDAYTGASMLDSDGTLQ